MQIIGIVVINALTKLAVESNGFTIRGGEIFSTVSDQMNPKNDLWTISMSIMKIIYENSMHNLCYIK